MKLLLQRVTQASVSMDHYTSGRIERGLVVFVGIASSDTLDRVVPMVTKLCQCRLFPQDQSDATQPTNGRFDRSLIDITGDLLIVSQFTLMADCKKGRRPYFGNAAPPGQAKALIDHIVTVAETMPIGQVQTGQFGAMMQVTLCNDGPVTLLLDSCD